MNAKAKPSFDRYAGVFLFGIGVVGIIVVLVTREAAWNGLWQLITGMANLFIGIDLFRRARAKP